MVDKLVLESQKQLVKDRIVEVSSRMIKDHDSPVDGGMTEIAYRFIEELDNLMSQLDDIDAKIVDHDIDRDFPSTSNIRKCKGCGIELDEDEGRWGYCIDCYEY